jgi:hypothetical protein
VQVSLGRCQFSIIGQFQFTFGYNYSWLVWLQLRSYTDYDFNYVYDLMAFASSLSSNKDNRFQVASLKSNYRYVNLSVSLVCSLERRGCLACLSSAKLRSTDSANLGMCSRPRYRHLLYNCYIDVIRYRYSSAYLLEHNCLGPGILSEVVWAQREEYRRRSREDAAQAASYVHRRLE